MRYFVPAILAVILLARIPISMGDASNLRYSATVVFIWSVLIALSVFISVKANPWIGGFLFLSLISSQYPFITQFSQEAFFLILIGCIWYLICVRTLTDRGIEWTLDLLCLFAMLNVAFLILQYFDLDPLYSPVEGMADKYKLAGLANYPHGCSAILAMCFPAFLRSWRKWGLIPLALGLVLTQTFSGPMALCTGIVFMVAVSTLHLRVKIGVVVGVLVALTLYMVIDGPNADWRYKGWKLAVTELIPKHWVMGYGLGFWKIKFAQPDIIEKITEVSSKREFFQQAHNEYIQGVFEMGIGFIVLVIGYFVDIFRRIPFIDIQSLILPLTAVIVLSVGAMVAFPFHESYSAAIGLTLMAIIENRLRWLKQGSRLL